MFVFHNKTKHNNMIFLILAASLVKCGFLPSEIQPNSYVCYKLSPNERIVIDGKINDHAWKGSFVFLISLSFEIQ